jgi:hypothetical protein
MKIRAEDLVPGAAGVLGYVGATSAAPCRFNSRAPSGVTK